MSKNPSSAQTRKRIELGLARRKRMEYSFRSAGIIAIVFALLCVSFLFIDITRRGLSAFIVPEMQLEIEYDAASMGIVDPTNADDLAFADYRQPLRAALRKLFPQVDGREQQRALYRLLSVDAELTLQERVTEDPQRLGTTEILWVKANSDIELYLEKDAPATAWREWVTQLHTQDLLRTKFNSTFFTAGDSRNPESAGIRNAVLGTALSLLVCFLITFPIGVAASIYLEEFAPANYWTDFLEININNLAAVPSVIFGLLGLAVLINIFGMPRSTPLTAGAVLALMTLPTIIISSRAAIKSVPPSIREAALALGASRLQMVHSQVLPAALPGMLTGSIIGMAGALGETAPLLMIGMVAFIAATPTGFTDAAVVLPVQIFLWADSPESAFVSLTSAAIMVLLLFLIVMNAAATILRIRLERRW